MGYTIIRSKDPELACKNIGWVDPDSWQLGDVLYIDPQKPREFQLRLKTGHAYGVTDIAVRIKVTGKRRFIRGDWRNRCKITVVGDGEPDVVLHGYVLYN